MTKITMESLLAKQGLTTDDYNKAHVWLNKLNDKDYEQELEMINFYKMNNHLTWDQAQVAIWKERMVDSI